jgi:hypothetical protein
MDLYEQVVAFLSWAALFDNECEAVVLHFAKNNQRENEGLGLNTSKGHFAKNNQRENEGLGLITLLRH